MDIEVSRRENGILLEVADRIDAFSFDKVKGQMTSATSQGPTNIAIDLSKATFLSLPSIKFIHSLSLELQTGGRSLSLISITEKMKRQIDIYASLEPLFLFKNVNAWEKFTSEGEA